MNAVLTYEQEYSAHKALERAGLFRGDTNEVLIVVGALSPLERRVSSHIAFCSASVKNLRRIRRGWFWQRWEPITGEIIFTNAEMIARALSGWTGIVSMKAIVCMDTTISITVDVDSIQMHGVEEDQKILLRNQGGMALSRNVLTAVL